MGSVEDTSSTVNGRPSDQFILLFQRKRGLQNQLMTVLKQLVCFITYIYKQLVCSISNKQNI